jgi:hypothetical protein
LFDSLHGILCSIVNDKTGTFMLISLALLEFRVMLRFNLSNPENFHKALQVYISWNEILKSWFKKQGDLFLPSELLPDRIGLSYHETASSNTKNGS